MVYISNLQRETLLTADKLINEGKNWDEVRHYFFDNGYSLRVPLNKNGQPSKTTCQLVKDSEYSFVDLKKKRNGFCEWETIRLF